MKSMTEEGGPVWAMAPPPPHEKKKIKNYKRKK
jgi:hypothetical protein